jgi:hypothetical protein
MVDKLSDLFPNFFCCSAGAVLHSLTGTCLIAQRYVDYHQFQETAKKEPAEQQKKLGKRSESLSTIVLLMILCLPLI